MISANPAPATSFVGRICRSSLPLLVLLGLSAGVWSTPAYAQQQRRDPDVIKQIYFLAFRTLYNGDYDNALEIFTEALRGAIQTPDARWIDSICYHTMIGETHYRRGDLRNALENYDAALRLYLQYPDWMLLVEFPDRIEPQQGVVNQPPWGRSQRRFRLGAVPSKLGIRRGGLRLATVAGQPAITNIQQLHPLHVSELVRCTTLAITRRTELLGPVGYHDKLTQAVLNTLSARQGPPNHWAQCWIDLQLGAAFIANDKKDPAIKALTQSILAGGEFDHPLTCVAMLELGKLALDEGNYKAAATWLEEASYSAFYYDRAEVVEESLRLRALVHLISGGKGIYTPLIPANKWANTENLREIQSSLLTALAEQYALVGDEKSATAMLGQSTRVTTYRDLAKGWMGAKLNYVLALVHYLRDNVSSGDQALAAALQYQQHGSFRLFQIAAADAAYVNGHVRERSALELYEEVMREPSGEDWRRDPLEAFAVLLNPQPVAMEHWFEVAMQRKEVGTALDVIDRIRRGRFFGTLPMGGRLLGLRWIVAAPVAALAQESLLQRNAIIARYPEFNELQKKIDQLRGDVAQRPLLPADAKDALAQAKLITEIDQVGKRQEALLRKVAIGREPSSLVFPALTKTAYVQKQLRPDEAMLVFHVGKRNDHAFLITADEEKYWQVLSPPTVRERLSELLRSMGHYDQGRELSAEQLADNSWREASAALLKEIFADSKVELDGIKDLVIVPDDVYWYLPFEALYVGAGRQAMPLLFQTRIRYAPTLALAVPDPRGRHRSGDLAIVQGRLYPREEPEIAEEGFDEIRRVVPRAHRVNMKLQMPTVALATLLDGLVVLDDLEPGTTPLDLPPFQVDKGRPGASIGEWLSLPWGSPEVVILPGFHTPAESSLKRLDKRDVAGEELFLTSLALQAAGTRTVVISRWRTAGRTVTNLMREFLLELPHTSASDAWQRAVLLATETPLDPQFEPRVAGGEGGAALTASHPFFWSGYVLVDPGNDPAKLDAP